MGRDGLDFASKLLKEIEKRSVAQIHCVPQELCCGEIVDLHLWSLILTDENMRQLSEQSVSEQFPIIDSSKKDVPAMFSRFLELGSFPKGLLSLNISNAKEVTNLGLTRVARRSPFLQELDISGCINIGDAGVREIGLNCGMLTSLNLSSCQTIEGGGLVAVADCCKLLRKLNVSKCRSIQKWGLTKIFYECKKLEEVDISYLKDVGDEEVRVLAQNCFNLFRLAARETPLISDQAILALSQHCPDLDYLDTSRSQMAFRISDVSLLALGQQSTALRTLKMSGCDHISDVGLAWLTEGCKVLEELDFSGCSRISDAGLRSLGQSCHILSSLNISHAKIVSDIGLASLSTGCGKLKKLQCAGLFQLADPRLSVPKLNASASVVGIAALARSCPGLEHLDLSECFRLNIAIQKHIPSLTKLRALLLSTCPLSPESVAAVIRSCPLLTELNLSDCGRGVNGTCLRSLAALCPHLRTLHLGRCENVKGSAIEAMSQCVCLERLDLAGCCALTDDMMLPLSRGDTLPSLRYLSLVNTPLLTNATLFWLASSSSRCIQHLSLRGSSIRKPALMATRDSFPHSDAVINDNFFGFWPRSRVDDRALVVAYCKMKSGFVKLQARQRGKRDKKIVQRVREGKLQHAAAVVVQCFIRCSFAKGLLGMAQGRRCEVLKAAVLVTSFFRIVIAKGSVLRLRRAKLSATLIYSATKIQQQWRAFLAKKTHFKLLQRREVVKARRRAAALRIQCLARRVAGKNVVTRIKAMKRSRKSVVERSCVLVQRCFRGYVGRRFCRSRVRLIKEREERLVLSSKLIQHAVRRYWLCSALKRAVLWRGRRTQAATAMQAFVRGFLARLLILESNMGMEVVSQESAANTLQYAWRVKKAYLTVWFLRAERERAFATRWDAAAVIQKHQRSRIGRAVVSGLWLEVENKIREKVEVELWAVSKIQALYRGNVGRLLFDDKVRERKGIWKELFDEEKQRRFFYNKLTGEVRWKMPQDLLDLIPRPQCDNCCALDACVECSYCNEFFCGQCWDQVHHGGRRRDHQFRALYDYYGKRLDYGEGLGAEEGQEEGLFPCTWPSDIVQDEVHGWMLRIAPSRQPVAVHGLWEKYAEEGAVGEGGRAFYFNRGTFEATYVPPNDVINEADTELSDTSSLYGHRTDFNSAPSGDTLGQGRGGYYDAQGQWVYEYNPSNAAHSSSFQW